MARQRLVDTRTGRVVEIRQCGSMVPYREQQVSRPQQVSVKRRRRGGNPSKRSEERSGRWMLLTVLVAGGTGAAMGGPIGGFVMAMLVVFILGVVGMLGSIFRL